VIKNLQLVLDIQKQSNTKAVQQPTQKNQPYKTSPYKKPGDNIVVSRFSGCVTLLTLLILLQFDPDTDIKGKSSDFWRTRNDRQILDCAAAIHSYSDTGNHCYGDK